MEHQCEHRDSNDTTRYCETPTNALKAFCLVAFIVQVFLFDLRCRCDMRGAISFYVL